MPLDRNAKQPWYLQATLFPIRKDDFTYLRLAQWPHKTNKTKQNNISSGHGTFLNSSYVRAHVISVIAPKVGSISSFHFIRKETAMQSNSLPGLLEHSARQPGLEHALHSHEMPFFLGQVITSLLTCMMLISSK